MSFIPVEYAFEALLKSKATIVSAVSTRIFIMPPGIPRDFPVSASLDFMVLPGLTNADGNPFEESRILLRHWAGSVASVRVLEGLVSDAIHGVTNQTVTVSAVNYKIMSVLKESSGQAMQAPDNKKWGYSAAYYNFAYGTRAL